MVDFERRKDFLYRDSNFDRHTDYNKSKILDERYRSCRSPRADNFRYSVSYRMSRSRQLDYDIYYSDRSRSRESYRSKYDYYDDRLRSNSKQLIHSDIKSPQDGESSYSKKRYLLEDPLPCVSYMHNSIIDDLSGSPTSRNLKFSSCNEFDTGLFASRLYMKPNTYLVDDITNKENVEDKMTLIKDNSKNRVERVNSLLGDGPEHLRIYPAKFNQKKVTKKHTLYAFKILIKSVDEPENVGINNKRILNTPISPNIVHNNFSIPKYLENKIAVFDYNHQDHANVINLNKPVLDAFSPESKYFELSRDPNKDNQIVSVGNSCSHIENKGLNQIKSASNLLANSSAESNDFSVNIKWFLIPLDAPLRVSISADNININNCSKQDPRIEHLV